MESLRNATLQRRLIDGTVDDMSVLGGHRGSYRIAAGPLPADANPTDCQYEAGSNGASRDEFRAQVLTVQRSNH